ncbi:MAG: hypothetical protein HYY04_08055 [Chloroflexi bacterium]|nr:hypothetical protein [Chloroflexota bacterium]
MERIDHLLQTLAGLTPRQATVFLLHFDGCFSWIVGREATATERMVAIAALRRLVREHG